MYQIVIIGVGRIGIRHLQALENIQLPISITLVDPSKQSLAIAKQRFEQVFEKIYIQQISYVPSIKLIKNAIDVAIIATTADIREQVIIELLMQKSVRFLILEKLVFQSVASFQRVQNLLWNQGINTWVNCPRRMYPFLSKIKGIFSAKRKNFFLSH